MILLIDADTPCYASAAICEEVDENIAIWEFNNSMERLLEQVKPSSYKVFVSGNTNFRYSIYPEYKANRIGQPRPRHLQAVKDAAVRNWDAIASVNCEADDLLGIEQMSYIRYGKEESCIASIDKDLNQIPGKHFHPGIKRKDVWLREPHFYTITPDEALRFFYYQLLVGDTTDNIKGASGIGPKKAEKILAGCKTDWDYFQACLPYFSCLEELEQNAKCLYIWQNENDEWKPPMEKEHNEV